MGIEVGAKGTNGNLGEGSRAQNQPPALSLHHTSECVPTIRLNIQIGKLRSKCACILNHLSLVSNSLQPYGLYPTRLLCPWDSPGKNTGTGCHFLLQGIFPTQGLNQHLLWLMHCKKILYLPLSHRGIPEGQDQKAKLGQSQAKGGWGRR